MMVSCHILQIGLFLENSQAGSIELGYRSKCVNGRTKVRRGDCDEMPVSTLGDN